MRSAQDAQGLNFLDCIDSSSIIRLRSRSKQGAISELLNTIADRIVPDSSTAVLEALLKREELMSTGIGLGIGMPHARHGAVDKPAIAIGISPEGIIDYDSIDGSTVHILVMILAGPGQHRMYIALMSQIVRILKSGENRDNIILSADSPDEVLNFLRKES